ncbi:MAG: hypothetical protein MUF23_00465 [Pirellula sp.]|nr:hypothetical protein [Pirellula sp.]
MSNNRWKTCWLVAGILFLAVGGLSLPVPLHAEQPPFSVPDGFVVQRVADDRLAHDCFCMTIDAGGRPVVSGPGYLRTLVDEDADGVFDRGVEWTREVKQGAQGLWSEGRTLYWVSDGGLWRSDDTDGDLVANARAQRVLELPTGGEHDAHAIRRGPDGHWYLIVGNFAANVGRIANDPNAAIVRPRAGTLWRISPDFSRRGVWAHGLRNCYDFDFLPDGQIATYDSDDEREATLPWYRPTRVFVLGPGSDAGWCGAAWKDDDYRVTMPMVLARLGRGSPTGVAVYEHDAFPEKYRDAVFVLDWTFGRVITIFPSENLDPEQRIPDRIPSEVFMEPSGTAGFAPTSICVAPDGSLLVCVGGRGTMGAVYRVAYAPEDPSLPSPAGDPSPGCFSKAVEMKLLSTEEATTLESVVKSPAPWSAWSVALWHPQATPKVRRHLADLALGKIPIDGPVDVSEKAILRAAQMLTHLGERIPAERLQSSASSPIPAVRVSAWWLAGRQSSNPQEDAKLQRGMRWSNRGEADGTRWETHLGSDEDRLCWEAMGLKRWPMNTAQPPQLDSSPSGNSLRRTWLWAAGRNTSSSNRNTSTSRNPSKPLDLQIAELLFGPHRGSADKFLLDALSQRFSSDLDATNPRELMEQLCVMQSALGDRRGVFPLQTDAPADASDGYRGLYTSQLTESARNNWARWALFFATSAKKRGWDAVHAEAVRTMAMMEPSDQQSMSYLLDQITSESHPTSDIHMLCCLAQCTAPRTSAATNKTANGLADMVRKVKARGLYTDNQWPIRLNQLVSRLLSRDNKLGAAFIDLPQPCCNEDLALLNALPPAIQDQARTKIRNHLQTASPEEWSVPIIKFAVVEPLDEGLRTAFKNAMQLEWLRSTCLSYLSQSPQPGEYELYLNAIEDTDRSLWPDAWRGLAPLDARDPAREFPALAKLVSATLNSGASFPRQMVLERARTVAARGQRTPAPKSDSWTDWSRYLQSELDESQWNALIVPTNQADIESILKAIDGLKGNADRGAGIFQAKCALCHGGQSALGPSLSGITKRFSREDLARAIYEPSRDVPDRYRAVRVLTVDDEVLTGMVIYNAADGVTLQAADGSILRINQDQIEKKAYSTESIMPSGLLDDRTPQEVADLFAYLATIP